MLYFYNLTTLLQSRGFHSSASLYLLRTHKLFPKVDWERVDAGNYAVVDPVNPGVIMYLSEHDYIVMVRVAITSNRTLKVLASPGETPIAADATSDTSQNSPNPTNTTPWGELLNLRPSQDSKGRRARGRFLSLFESSLKRFLHKSKLSCSTLRGFERISMIGLTRENVVQWFQTWHDLVSWWSRGSLATTVHKAERTSFGLKLRTILVHNGISHLIARLKMMLFVVNAYLGGRRLSSTQSLGFRIRLSDGLPTMLPLFVRSGIRHGNRHYIHIWTSMLFAYKGILGTWQEPHLASGSICSKHPQIENSRAFENFKVFVGLFWDFLFNVAGAPRVRYTVKGTFFSTHAGPNHPITIYGAGVDAYLWFLLDRDSSRDSSSKDVTSWKGQSVAQQVTGCDSNYLREWLEATRQPDILLNIRKTAKMFALNMGIIDAVRQQNALFSIVKPGGIETPENSIPGKSDIARIRRKGSQEIPWVQDYILHFLGLNNQDIRFRNPTLQRLHNLYEAAGKVRTIAIVDYWTNFVLKPLHDWMFDVLNLLPQDATFDQEGRVREFAKRGYQYLYSYDLKSATDLIPLALYRALFGIILPARVLDAWFNLLVKRRFLVPRSTLKVHKDHPTRITYGTGQPMGALTSWASMALVHHALVLYAAVMTGAAHPSRLLDFKDYMVLGDDIVIANSQVAREYVRLMKSLNVPLSLHKSHISEYGMFNFANQTFVNGVNVSPVSLREEINASSLPERVEFTLRMARRGWMSLTSQRWVVNVLKRVLRPDVWTYVSPYVNERKVHPVVNWILAVMLTPGTTRYAFTGICQIGTEAFLGAQLRKGKVFGTPITSFASLIDRKRTEALQVSILGKWVNSVYSQFLTNRKRLEGYPLWVTKMVSVDLEWLFNRVFEEARSSAIQRWTEQYRLALKELQIVTNSPLQFGIEGVEIGSGRRWEDIVSFVATAEGKLPIVPDFSQETLEALSSLLPEGAEATKVRFQRQRDSFMRITNLLGMIDHLGPHGTPGANAAWEYSQSSVKTENKSPES